MQTRLAPAKSTGPDDHEPHQTLHHAKYQGKGGHEVPSLSQLHVKRYLTVGNQFFQLLADSSTRRHARISIHMGRLKQGLPAAVCALGCGRRYIPPKRYT